MKAKWDAEKGANQVINEEQEQAEEDLSKLQGPILYMIIGIVCMLIAISAVIKIILCGKGNMGFNLELFFEGSKDQTWLIHNINLVL